MVKAGMRVKLKVGNRIVGGIARYIENKTFILQDNDDFVLYNDRKISDLKREVGYLGDEDSKSWLFIKFDRPIKVTGGQFFNGVTYHEDNWEIVQLSCKRRTVKGSLP